MSDAADTAASVGAVSPDTTCVLQFYFCLDGTKVDLAALFLEARPVAVFALDFEELTICLAEEDNEAIANDIN